MKNIEKELLGKLHFKQLKEHRMSSGHDVPSAWAVFERANPEEEVVVRRGVSAVPQQHYNWPSKDRDHLLQWCDRSTSTGRPRTYDKFYQKTPGNFHSGAARAAAASSSSSPPSSDQKPPQGDSAISACSSEDDAGRRDGGGGRRVRRRSKGRRGAELGHSRTVTERDVRHLERHLSMKKTIRKKMMRDLRQAFVDNAGGGGSNGCGEGGDGVGVGDDLTINFGVGDGDGERRMALLDMLRGDGCGSDDSGIGEQQDGAHRHHHGSGGGGKRKFHSMRETSSAAARNRRRNEEEEEAAALAVGALKLGEERQHQQGEEERGGGRGGSGRHEKKRSSFWQIFRVKKKE